MDKREIILQHYSKPQNKKRMESEEYTKENTRNSSCIDNLDIYIKIKDSYIEDITFDGEACAISISSASIMTKNLNKKSVREGLEYIKNFENMLNEKEYEQNILKEAIVYENTKNTSRKTCAWLPYDAAKKLLEKNI